MARVARVVGGGVAQHVMVRGIERRRIFRDDLDRRDFVARLDRILPEEGWSCFAWALMPNHVHLVMQGSGRNLSRVMARLGTGYARGFNARHGRSGHLFQNRFKSRVVVDDADLLAVVVYTHRNPLEGRLVPSVRALESYPWCGHPALVGRRPGHPFEAVSACLGLLADDPSIARGRLDRWMEQSPACEGKRGGSDRVAARGATPDEPPSPLDSSRSRGPRSALEGDLRWAVSNADPRELLDALMTEVARHLDLSKAQLRRPSRGTTAADARAIVAYLAAALELPGTDIASALGVSPSAVSHAIRRGRAVSGLHDTGTRRILSAVRRSIMGGS